MSARDEEPSSSLTAALEAAGDVAYSWELDADRLDWSGRLPDAWGEFASELATGRRFAGRIHPDDLVHRQLMLANHFDGDSTFDCEYRVRGRGGILPGSMSAGGRSATMPAGRSVCSG